MKEEFIFKIVLLGDGMVGKTSLRHRYLGKEFTTNYLATLGADFAIKELDCFGYHVRYQIWDLAGQVRFEGLRKSFYLGSQGALILYDVTNRDSFRNIDNWINEYWNNNGKGRKMPVVLIGNKIDLRKDHPEAITFEEGKSLAIKLKNNNHLGYEIPFIETSAATGDNIDLAFKTITEHYMTLFNMIN